VRLEFSLFHTFGLMNSMFNRGLAFTLNMSENLELCPECKEGHLYPVVTARVSAEAKGIRNYECAICGHKQIGAKQTQNVDVKDKASATVIKAKKQKQKQRLKKQKIGREKKVSYST
jgi:DNA-directed RNA polymerase subunit M/transcription elongation factor TFIIS